MGEQREFSAEFKVGVVQRMLQGESGTRLHLELGIKRSLLYRWRDAFRRDGEAGLSRKVGRPSKDAGAAGLRPSSTSDNASSALVIEQAAQIAELERVVGKLTLQNDFLARAFKRVKESRPASDASGATASTGRSGT